MNTAQISTRWKINLVLLPGSKRRLVQSTLHTVSIGLIQAKWEREAREGRGKEKMPYFLPSLSLPFASLLLSPKKCLIKNAILQYWPNVLHYSSQQSRGTLQYKLYGYVRCQRVWVFSFLVWSRARYCALWIWKSGIGYIFYHSSPRLQLQSHNTLL